MTDYILFPGRHHLLTGFQEEYLRHLAADSGPPRTVVWAVTSANHQNTRRNPVAYHRREAAIERFSAAAGLRSLVVPVFDTAPTDRFAEVTLKTIIVATGIDLRPDNTIVACSTPVADLYERLGFRIALVEADPAYADRHPERPWDVLLRLAGDDPAWRDHAHPATVDVFDRYRLDDVVRTVVNDPIVGDEGGLTPSRNYRTYMDAFADGAQRKWAAVRDYVRPGRIVDIGCGAGSVLELADREPRLHESDLIGVEVARHLYEECVHKKAQGVYANPNVFFYRRNVLGGAIFPPRSVDTTLTFALTHEIWSYGDREKSLLAFARAVYEHTAPGGVWINSDVCGPDEPHRPVRLRLDRTDGDNPARPRRDLAERPSAEVAAYVASLSTRARFDQFWIDFRHPMESDVDGDVIVLSWGTAMDYLTHKDYAENWTSEMQEQFCGLSYADWAGLLREVGFEVDRASRAIRNDWIVANRIAPVASATDLDGRPIEWPVTHLLAIGRRPLST